MYGYDTGHLYLSEDSVRKLDDNTYEITLSEIEYSHAEKFGWSVYLDAESAVEGPPRFYLASEPKMSGDEMRARLTEFGDHKAEVTLLDYQP